MQLLWIISTQAKYIYQKFNDINIFVKLRAVSKLPTFSDTLCRVEMGS